MPTDEQISLNEATRRSGVPASTLKRWAEQKIVEVDGGKWDGRRRRAGTDRRPDAERGHSLREIRGAVRDGRLAFGSVEDLLPSPSRRHSRADAAAIVGLEEDLVERVMALLGTPMALTDRISDEDIAALERMAGALHNGFPLIALLQLVRVYAQAGRKIAEAEVRLFHLFVHEPMIRDGFRPWRWPRTWSGWSRSCCRRSRPCSSTSTPVTCASTWSRTSSGTWKPICR